MTTISKRAKRYTTPVAQLRRWRSRGGQYALVEIVSAFGLPSRYVVIERLPNGNERIISRHRLRRAAERRLAKLHEANQCECCDGTGEAVCRDCAGNGTRDLESRFARACHECGGRGVSACRECQP